MKEWEILMVDDDPEDRFIIEDAFRQLKSDVVVRFADSGEIAIDLLHEKFLNGTTPRLIVLDLNMPRMNGTEVLAKLKNDERFKGIPMIIYSTSINPLEREKCMELGAHSYITKPISYSQSIETAKLFLQLSGSVFQEEGKKTGIG